MTLLNPKHGSHQWSLSFSPRAQSFQPSFFLPTFLLTGSHSFRPFCQLLNTLTLLLPEGHDTVLPLPGMFFLQFMQASAQMSPPQRSLPWLPYMNYPLPPLPQLYILLYFSSWHVFLSERMPYLFLPFLSIRIGGSGGENLCLSITMLYT